MWMLYYYTIHSKRFNEERNREMEHLEKVEKLREKANVSYEEAKAALESCDWDILDALVKLESEGKVNIENTADLSTKGDSAEDEPKSPQQLAESYQSYHQKQHKKEKGFWHSIKNSIKYLFRKGCENKFIVRRHGEIILDIPVLLLIVLMIAFFWALLILMVIGLFFGFSYSFAGPELGRDDINSAMGKATSAAEALKTEIREYDSSSEHSK